MHKTFVYYQKLYSSIKLKRMAVTIYYPARIRVALIEHLMIFILEAIKAKKNNMKHSLNTFVMHSII